MRKLLAIDIRGKYHEWTFLVQADPRYLDEWRADGLHIEEVVNVVPQWWVTLGLPVAWWCWMQDLWNRRSSDRGGGADDYDEMDSVTYCQACGSRLQAVRPGKWQCPAEPHGGENERK